MAELQTAKPIPEGTKLVIYKDEAGTYWARPEQEFDDGRFEAVEVGIHED